ncbi:MULTISPECIES: DUF4376 domain-containing protein [unclassified Methylomonas]|uniref:DUF4376 domain-containing protein n=2 Tax=Methylomonas TaxID=416 RepID=UPI00047D9690|nr:MULTISPECIES: hypothetical protein [unclassified Methylomonas]QSA99542.1 hypothetical protein JWZ98_12645 [Methylomonas sp. EFPC1]QSB03469.1 hypothetical protein JWZ98_11330 [Methylomonas sp. EFPC1]
MRLAEINNGVVVNVVESEAAIGGFVESNTANIGDQFVGGLFLPQPLSMSIIRDQLFASVDIERARLWRSGFPVQIGGVAKWFHSDEFSLTQHLGLKDKARDVLSAGGTMNDDITIGGQPVQWSTMDGSSVTITVQVAFDLVSSAGLQQAMVFAASQAHKAAIQTAADLSNYDVLSNWPAVFGE